ncbi:MAG: ATP-binding protein [Bacteroidales bacterium]|nr:ATP-binding protein [Bacteroidales bacterium]
MGRIVSRKQQISELTEIYNSGKSEFVVVYGRRRIGKTFLVREMFKDKFVFYHTALSPIELDGAKLTENQLIAFATTLKNYGAEYDKQPQNWIEAFDELRKLVSKHADKKRVVVFIDEMPWLDTKDSGFITGFEHFWNGFGDGCHNLMLIVCGSATTWISDKLINNYGGLYNRITHQICLEAFTLGECEEYYRSIGIEMSRYDQTLCYMALGGIPYYMSQLKKGMSVAQNIDNLFFKSNAVFKDEFNRLCASQFLENDKYKAVLKFLSTKRLGYTRREISVGTKIPFGGGLTEILKALEVSEFIMAYTFFEGSKRNVYYKLTDMFTLFWMHFLNGETTAKSDYFQSMLQSPKIKSWQGFAFEELCFAHRKQIARALGISGIHNEFLPWRYIGDSESDGAQIDMLIDRADNMIDLCEMKFYADEFAISKEYDANLRHKLQTFLNHSKSKKSVNMVLVTTYGLKHNMYFSRFQHTVTIDDLF